jgi:ABC-type transporter lipoprotein component MlaA
MSKTSSSNFPVYTAALLVMVHCASCTSLPPRETTPTNKVEELPYGQMPYLDAVPDPIEGFNRCSWAFNDWVFRGVVYPLSFGYNSVTPKPVRTKIGNAGHNLAFPVRFFNSCFQGKWNGAWEETERFFVNSTAGLGGFFDPATPWKIGRSEEDFGQTLGHYGWGPGFYLVIPFFGPSNGRDALGRIVDWPMDIGSDLTLAYPNKLWSMAIRPGIAVNDLSGEARDYKRRLDYFVDPYQAFRTLYSLDRQRLILDCQPNQQGQFNPNPTVRAVLFEALTPNFADKAVTRQVYVPATGRKLAYSCWMQKEPAPLVCYIPGLGSYRLDRSTVAYADMMYRHGYSVVAFSNPFQQEFMESASTMAVPGYGPADCDDVVAVLKSILADMRKWKGDKITGTSLTGVSHGGYFTLLIAAREAAGQLDGLTFDRYVAVNPPPRLAHAEQRLDEMFDAPLDWPAAERRDRMNAAIYKALYFADHGLEVSGNIPLTRTESDFLIGLVFRYTLMSAIEDSQRRHDLGVLKVNPDKFVRQDSYREIQQIGYEEYTDRFVLPYLIKTGRATNREQLIAATDLDQSTDLLRSNSKIRVQISGDDFLLAPSDISWFRSTFGTNLTIYPDGGHLGNLHISDVQEALVRLFPDRPTKSGGKMSREAPFKLPNNSKD